MIGLQFSAHARSKNFGSSDDMNGFLNVAKNKYSVNQAVDVGRIDRLMPIAILFKTRLKYNDIQYFVNFIIYSGKNYNRITNR